MIKIKGRLLMKPFISLLLATFAIESCIASKNSTPHHEDHQPERTWAEEADEKYKLSNIEIQTLRTFIKTPEDWEDYKEENLKVSLTWYTREEAELAINEQQQLIQAEIADCLKTCSRLQMLTEALFDHPATHPSRLTFENFESAVTKVVNSQMTVGLDVSKLVNKIYILPYSKLSSERTWRAKIAYSVKQCRDNLPTTILKMLRLEDKYTELARLTLNEFAAGLISEGLSGPYLMKCDDLWEKHYARILKFRGHCQFLFLMENELVRWLYNTGFKDSGINFKDYNLLTIYWEKKINNEQFASQMLQTFWLAQQALLRELYLRGFMPEDFTQMLQGESALQDVSWLNILSITRNYMSRDQQDGTYSFHHPDHIKMAIQGCLDIYFPARFQDEADRLFQDLSEGEEQPIALLSTPSKHDDEELKPEFILAMRTMMAQLTDRCLEVKAIIGHESTNLLANLISVEKVLGDTLLRCYKEDNENSLKNIDDEDKELYFRVLDVMESYLPMFSRYLLKLEDKLHVK